MDPSPSQRSCYYSHYQPEWTPFVQHIKGNGPKSFVQLRYMYWDTAVTVAYITKPYWIVEWLWLSSHTLQFSLTSTPESWGRQHHVRQNCFQHPHQCGTAQEKGYENSQSCQDNEGQLCRTHGLCLPKLQLKFAETHFKITPTNTVFSESWHLHNFESGLENCILCVVLEIRAFKVTSTGTSLLVTVLRSGLALMESTKNWKGQSPCNWYRFVALCMQNAVIA